MERPAFDRLLTAALPEIQQAVQKYAILYRRAHEWEDVAQTVLLKMLRFADQYDPYKGDLVPWACVIIINTIKTSVAQKSVWPVREEFNDLIIDRTPAHADSNPEELAQAAFILSNLNEEARLFVEGYNYPEIAARRGFRSRSTARARIDNCGERLSRILGITANKGRRTRMYAKV